MNNDAEALRNAIRSLHRAKDAAYGNAWKKRGEVLSIVANIARKVDRLEHVRSTDSAPTDESVLDTAVDLLVYCLKYQLFLADSDATVARLLFRESDLVGTFSDGTEGFEYLLDQANLTSLAGGGHLAISNAIDEVLGRFSKLEACFSGLAVQPKAPGRLIDVQHLADAAIGLIAVIRYSGNEGYQSFILRH